jgi:hypothetical protein
MIILAAIGAHRSFAGAHASRRGQRTSERQAHCAAAALDLPRNAVWRVTAAVGSVLPAIGPDSEVDQGIAAYEVAVKHFTMVELEVDRIGEMRPAGLKWSDGPVTEPLPADDMLAGREAYVVWAQRVNAATAQREAAKAEHAAAITAWEDASGFHQACLRSDAAVERVNLAEEKLYICRPQTLRGLLAKLNALASVADEPNNEDPAETSYRLLAEDVKRLLTAACV